MGGYDRFLRFYSYGHLSSLFPKRLSAYTQQRVQSAHNHNLYKILGQSSRADSRPGEGGRGAEAAGGEGSDAARRGRGSSSTVSAARSPKIWEPGRVNGRRAPCRQAAKHTPVL